MDAFLQLLLLGKCLFLCGTSINVMKMPMHKKWLWYERRGASGAREEVVNLVFIHYPQNKTKMTHFLFDKLLDSFAKTGMQILKNWQSNLEFQLDICTFIPNTRHETFSVNFFPYNFGPVCTWDCRLCLAYLPKLCKLQYWKINVESKIVKEKAF